MDCSIALDDFPSVVGVASVVIREICCCSFFRAKAMLIGGLPGES